MHLVRRTLAHFGQNSIIYVHVLPFCVHVTCNVVAAGIVDLGQRLSGLMVEGALFLCNNAAVDIQDDAVTT